MAAGGGLTLHNTRLTVQSVSAGQHGIRVQSGGAITIEAGSVITAAWSSGPFTFTLELGAGFIMRDSALHGCGYGSPYGTWPEGPHGLTIYAANPIIENNLFAGDFSGVRLLQNHGGLIRGNDFRENVWAGLELMSWTGGNVRDNRFADSINALYVANFSENNSFIGNSFTRHYEGAMWMFSSRDNEFSDNTVTDSGGIFFAHRSSSNLVHHNTFNQTGIAIGVFQSTHTDIRDNTIAGAEHAGILLSYADHSIVTSNVLTDTGTKAAIYLLGSQHNTIVNNRISELDSCSRTAGCG